MASDLHPWLRIEQLQYVRLGDRLAVVRLLAALGAELVPPSGAHLVIERGDNSARYPARAGKVQRARRLRLLGGELLWRACFAVPLDVVEYPQALFEFTAPGHPALALPAPGLRALPAPRAAGRRGHPLPAGPARRRLLVVATTLVVTGSTPGIALAASGAHHTGNGAGDSLAPHGARAALSTTKFDGWSRVPTASIHGTAKFGLSRGVGVAGGGVSPAAAHHRAAPARHTDPPAPAPTAPRYGLGPARAVTSAPVSGPGTTGGALIGAPAGRPKVHPGRTARPAEHRPAPRPETSTPPPAPVAGALPTPAAFAVAGQGSGSAASTAWSRLSRLLASGDRPPAFLIPIYKAAGHRYHVPWPVLAAINSIETDYGRDVNTSSSGAIGWMQFMPGTWAEYGVAVGRHSRPDPYDPRDAIFSAARYLAANGAAHHLRKAIFAYNHATWYVDEVLWTAAGIADHTPAPGSRVRRKLDAMQEMAEALDGEPYVWGGGHSGWELAPGYDCSGFVSTVLHAAGYLEAPATTQTLPAATDILPGPGRYVTVFDRTDGGAADDDHVIIDLNGRWWESGGSSTAGGAPQVHRITGISASYLLSFNEILHPRGL